MPKSKEAKTTKKKNVAYLGTTESIAKLAPHGGIEPHQLPPHSSHYDDVNGGKWVYLSSVYAGYFALDAAGRDRRWGVVEVDLNKLCQNGFLPYEGYLADRSRKKISDDDARKKLMAGYRKDMGSKKEKWKDSLDECGVVLYAAKIPADAVNKVAIYDPRSNKYITDEIAKAVLHTSAYKDTFARNQLLTKWLMAELVELEDWLHKSATVANNDDRTRISLALMNKYGLDIFYS